MLGRQTRPEVRGPVALLPPLLLDPPLLMLVNSCWGARPPRTALLLLLPLLLLTERVRRCVLPVGVEGVVVVRRSRICFRDRSDMLLSRPGVVGPAAGEAELLPLSLLAAVAAAADGVPAPPSPLLLFLPVASTSRLMDTEEVAGLHTLPQPPLQLVQADPALLPLLMAAFLTAAAAAVAAAMLAAAGVMPHMSGGGLGPFLAL